MGYLSFMSGKPYTKHGGGSKRKNDYDKIYELADQNMGPYVIANTLGYSVGSVKHALLVRKSERARNEQAKTKETI